MTTKLYENCEIAVTLERDTYVISVPKELEPFFGISDQLDDFWEDSFADIHGLQPGVYFCSIQREGDETDGTIFVGEIVRANLVSNHALQMMQSAHMELALKHKS